MKKIFTKLMLLAVAAAALVSCENKFEEQTPGVELTQTVTLSAEKPTQVRTELIEGVPYWSKGDQIGVYVQDGDTYKNYAFKNDNTEGASLTTTFTGTTAVANTLYVYYPYTNFSTPVTEKGVKVEILANQEPTATSFDGRTDLMIAKPVTLDAEGKQLSGLEFARVAAIVKIVLKDKTGNLAGQHVSSLTMTAATNLVGRVYLDVVNQEIFTGEGGGLYYGGAPSVNATYTEATQYEVNGTNATYVVVYPQTLAAGSKLTIEASTEGYAISKEITLPSDIELLAGKVTTLNVSLAAENVVKEETGLALPVEDDFSWITSDNESGAIDTALNGDLYSSGSKVYPLNSANTGKGVKFGSSSVAGSITTVDLNLSQPFSVIFDAKKYGSDASKIQVTAGDQVLATATLVDAWTTYVLEFEAVDAKEQITIEVISDTRAYLDNLKVVAGHDYVLPPVLTVSTAEISGVSHEGEAKTFTYSVANPVEGTSVVITADAEWLTTADNNGTVTVTVAENTLEEVRNATITVKYGDLTKTIAVQQNAKPAAGGATENTVTHDFTKISFTGWTNSYAAHTVEYDEATVTFEAASKQTGTITNMPVTKGKYVALVAKNGATIKSAKFVCKQWSSKTQTITLHYSTNGGTSYTSTNVTSSNFTISKDNLPEGTNAVKITFSSSSNQIGVESATITYVSGSEGGETPETPAPVLSVNPTTLSFDAAAASKTVTCTIENEVSGVNVTATENVDWLSTSVSGTTVTITATENTGAAREADVTIAYDGAESKTIKVSQAAGNTGGGDEPEQGGTHFVKVTSAPSDWSGTYLIVYEDGKIAFNGSLASPDTTLSHTSVTISDSKIEATDAMKAIAVTITKSGDNYAIKTASGKYIYGTSGSNKLNSQTSASYTNTISIESNSAKIVSNTSVLRFNSASNEMRFRYYKSSSYTNQKAIQLYKLN